MQKCIKGGYFKKSTVQMRKKELLLRDDIPSDDIPSTGTPLYVDNYCSILLLLCFASQRLGAAY